MNTVCPAVWNHLCINTVGKNRLCCNAITQENDYFLTNFDNHWTKFRDKIKQQMLNNEKPDVCKSCWDKEEIGVTSLRQQFIENYNNRNEVLNFSDNTVLELDLKLGNYCNLSCRMCSSFSSSSYAKEFKQIYKDTGIDYGLNDFEKTYVQNKWYTDPAFVNSIKSMIDNGLKQLKFTGGEPLMVPSVKTLLEYCIESNKANNIDIVLITNGTLLNKNWIDILNNFRHVSFIFSIDGVKDTFEYIRHPAKWDQVIGSFELLQNTKYYKAIAFTFQVYNVLDTVNILKLSREQNFCIDLISLDTPKYLDVKYIPDSLKTQGLNLIKNFVPSNKNEEKFYNDVRNKLINSNYNSFYCKRLVEISKIKDKYKMQNFNTLEIAKYYDKI